MTSADLTGRCVGYRGVAVRCPGCAAPMRQLSLVTAEAEVDVCDACGGLWVDWFDGEVRAIATETLRSSDPGLPVASKDTDDNGKGEARPEANEAAAVGACPRCTRQLVSERYSMTADVASDRVEGRTSLVAAATGASLLRCEDCMGAFVSRTSAEVLSWLSTHEQPPSSQSGTTTLQPLPWERLVALLKSFLGL